MALLDPVQQLGNTLHTHHALCPACANALLMHSISYNASETSPPPNSFTALDAIGHTSAANASATGPPTDPRLRRGSLPNAASPKNGALPLPFKPQPRPPSPEALGRLSPPPLPMIDLTPSEFPSPDEIKKGNANQQQSEGKSRSRSSLPSVTVHPPFSAAQELSTLSSNFETLASPECRIGVNSSVDTIQQRIG